VKSTLPISPQLAGLTLADSLVECVLYKERLRRENNRYAATIGRDGLPLEEFRKYQDEEFDVRDAACWDERDRVEEEIKALEFGRGN